MTQPRTQLQQLCVAVLCGDAGAEFALLDYLTEEYGNGRLDHALLLPARRIDVPLDRVRVAVFATGAVTDEWRRWVEDAVMDWMEGNATGPTHPPLVLRNTDRVEVYQLPDPRPVHNEETR